MITKTSLAVLRAVDQLEPQDPNTLVPPTVAGLTVEQLSDVVAQLVRLGLLRHFLILAMATCRSSRRRDAITTSGASSI